MEVTLRPREWTLERTLTTGAGRFGVRRSVELTIVQDGVIGRGEAAALPELGGESQAQCEEALARATERLRLEVAPDSLEAVEGLLVSLGRVLSSAPAARAAVECALLEVVACRAGLPLWTLVAPSAPPIIDANALLVSSAPDDLAREARLAVEAGFRTLKLKVGVGEDRRRVEAVRQAVGATPRIRIDANGAWSAETAADILASLKPLNLELCEQPVAASDLLGLAAVTGTGHCTVAADEALVDHNQRARVLESCGALVLKPSLLGGLLPALALARAASARGLRLVATAGFEGPVGRALAVHLAFALPAQGWAHGLATGRLLANAESPMDPRGGSIARPSEPGLGVPW